MLAAMTVGETEISGLLEGEDVMATRSALGDLGVDIQRSDDGIWRVQGVGVGGLREPDRVLDLGNAGTSARLICGLLAGHPFTTFLTGDASEDRKRISILLETLAEVNSSVDVSEVIRAVLDKSIGVTGAERAVIMLYDEEKVLRIEMARDLRECWARIAV